MGKENRVNGKAKKAISILSVTPLRSQPDLTTFPSEGKTAGKIQRFRSKKPIPSDPSPADRGWNSRKKRFHFISRVTPCLRNDLHLRISRGRRRRPCAAIEGGIAVALTQQKEKPNMPKCGGRRGTRHEQRRMRIQTAMLVLLAIDCRTMSNEGRDNVKKSGPISVTRPSLPGIPQCQKRSQSDGRECP